MKSIYIIALLAIVCTAGAQETMYLLPLHKLCEKNRVNERIQRFTTKFDSDKVTGSVNFTTPPPPEAAKGARVVLDLKFDDASTGPFSYHIHTHPIIPSRPHPPPPPPPSEGDGISGNNGCDAAKGHLDLGPPAPEGSDKKKCDSQKPHECETGDLSGKHGLLPAFSGGVSVWAEYFDHSIPLTPPGSTDRTGEGGQLVGRSIVVHDASGARIACANIEILSQEHRGRDGPARDGQGGKGGGEGGEEGGAADGGGGGEGSSYCTLRRRRRRM